MKNLCTSLLSVVALCSLAASFAAVPQSSPYEKQIDELLKKMTIEEKVGQTAQFTLNVIGQGGNIYESREPFELDNARMEEMFSKYKVGSILNTSNNRALTPEHWQTVITNIQKCALKYSKIPVIYGIDAIHGATYTDGATFFPQEIGMGATFNRELVYRGAQVAAYDVRASNTPWNFSPVLDLGRDARWARLWETYGEDAYLVSEMGVACVIGYQGDDFNKIGSQNVAACLKHFVGYGQPFSGKDRTPSYIPDHEMREKHFEPFLRAIEAGALSLMINSGMNNGVSVHANHELLTVWLKEQLKYDGVLVTDWQDINNLYRRDKIAANDKEAIKLAINAGIDMAMVPYDKKYCTYLCELVEQGEVPISRLDDAVRRVLRLKFRLGLFQTPYVDFKDYKLFGSEQHAKLALESAQESITLLKNKGEVLPLKKGVKVLVTGPNANSMRTLNGGWSYSWQGEKSDLFASKYNTILEAVQQMVGSDNVSFAEGVSYNMKGKYYAELAPDFDAAINAAAGVDYIIACVGENSYTEKPGDLDELALSDNQQELIRRLSATGKPIILVLNEGRPRIINRIEPLVDAVVQIYLPSNYGGDALAGILWGDVVPSGRLPYTYPKFSNSLITYDYKPAENQEKMSGVYDYESVTSVQYAFGYGLSYTTFEYSNLMVDKSQFKAGDMLTFSVDVKNSGLRDAKESVLLFISDEIAAMTPDNRRLRGFEKVFIKAGESRKVAITIPAMSLAYVNTKGAKVLELGDFNVQIGTQTAKITASEMNLEYYK